MIQTRMARWALVLLFVAVLLGSAYAVLSSERTADAARSSVATVERHGRPLADTVRELSIAEMGYVVPGQERTHQAAVVGALTENLRNQIAMLQTASMSREAALRTKAMRSGLEEFEGIDKRAQEYLRGDQRLAAADLTAGAGQEALKKILNELDELRRAEADTGDRQVRNARKWKFGVLAGAAMFGLTVISLLVPVPVLRDLPEATAPSGTVTENPAPPLPALSAQPDLDATSRLCTDLARVLGPGELPGLLERAAALLGASGLVIWLADEDAIQLRPALAHGYGPEVMPRLGVLARTANNATAAAFRTGQMQVVAPQEGAKGALVTPILTPDGPRGVLACEMPEGVEIGEVTQALARIIAAQLGTILDLAPSPSIPAEAQGGL